jgi:hypothetical protein
MTTTPKALRLERINELRYDPAELIQAAVLPIVGRYMVEYWLAGIGCAEHQINRFEGRRFCRRLDCIVKCTRA